MKKVTKLGDNSLQKVPLARLTLIMCETNINHKEVKLPSFVSIKDFQPTH
jgi:hypothetical protein